MATLLTNTNELTSIADAIRTKGGTSTTLVYPNGFVSAINSIPTGGGGGISPFPTSIDNPDAIMKITTIDLDGQYEANLGKQYPSVDLTELADRTINPENLMAAILNLRMGTMQGTASSSNREYDISAYFSQWIPFSTQIDYQNVPWLVGGWFRSMNFYQHVTVYPSVCLNGTGQYDFPNIRINQKTDTNHIGIHFVNPFDATSYNYTGSFGTYKILDLYNVILIEKDGYLN